MSRLTPADLPPPPSGRTGWPWTEHSPQVPPTLPDGRPWPLISVVTPSFNQGQFIEETIRSVLLQGFPELEYIIVDGGSTDATLDVIRRYEPWITNWSSGRDSGQAEAINKGLLRATGSILAWLNSDDYYLPGAFAHVAQTFHRQPAAGAVVGDGHIVDEQGKIVYTPAAEQLTYEAFLTWMRGGDFMQPSCFFSRAAWERCGPLDEALHYCLDVDLWLRMAQHFRFEKVPAVLSHSYTHRAAKTTASREHMVVETALMLLRHGETEAARRELLLQADDLAHLRAMVRPLVNNPFYRIFGPVYRFLVQRSGRGDA